MKNTFRYLLVILFSISLFSCNVLDITKRRYSKGYHVSTSNFKKEKKETLVNVENEEVVQEKSEKAKEEVVAAMAPVEVEMTPTIEGNSVSEQKPAVSNKTSLITKLSNKSATRFQAKKERRIQKLMERRSPEDTDLTLVLLVILAIILPPIAVYMKRGADNLFWITLLLFLLAVLGFVLFPVGGLVGLAAVVLALLAVFDLI